MIDRMNLLRTTALSGLLALAGGGVAFAGPSTETFSACYPGPCNSTQAPTDWNGSQTVSVPTFDTTLGTLNSVTITLLADVTSSGNLTNTAGSGTANITSYNSATVVRLLPVGYSGTTDDFSLAVSALTVVAPNLISRSFVSLLSGASTAFSVNDVQATNTYGAIFSGLGIYETLGAGNVLFPLFTTTSTNSNVSGGNLNLIQSTGAYAEVSITYDYTAPDVGVPEPASLALLGAGLAGIGAIRRRRKA